MRERIQPTIIVNTCELGPEAGERLTSFLYSIKNQVEFMHSHNKHHPWIPDDDVSMVRLSYAAAELLDDCGKVGPIEHYIEHVLTKSIETYKKLGEGHNKTRQNIDVFIECGITVLGDINPDKAFRTRTVMDRIKTYPPR